MGKSGVTPLGGGGGPDYFKTTFTTPAYSESVSTGKISGLPAQAKNAIIHVALGTEADTNRAAIYIVSPDMGLSCKVYRPEYGYPIVSADTAAITLVSGVLTYGMWTGALENKKTYNLIVW